jgi:enterochelin esterase-like enzyme
MRFARRLPPSAYCLLLSAFCLPLALLPGAASDLPRQPFIDCTHLSKVFGEERHYRLFLPPDYNMSNKAYPVIYYFHGHSDRYTLEKYDDGKDTVPKIAAFVATHPVMVVSVDGYVARDYQGFYGGTPWDVMKSGGDYDFGLYFRELVTHIDSTYRTLTSRRFRATSGLSMGGFMSLYLSARYPDLIGSASAFNPGPEFYVGDKGRRVLWRPKDHVANHTHTMVRLVRVSGDYISQYTEETHDAYARADDVDFEFRQDEYHRHWATSIGETFEFHLRAFAQSNLDNFPDTWDHDDAYSDFTVWGYQVKSVGSEPAITYLEDVSQGGVRVTTREWAPDGPPLPARRITIATAPLYEPGASYLLRDYNFPTGATTKQTLVAATDGRLTITTDGAGHQFSFAGPGAANQQPVLLPLTAHDMLRLPPNQDVALPIRIYNPRNVAMTDVKVALSSDYPTVQVLGGEVTIPKIEPGAAVDLSSALRARFTAGEGYFARTRLKLDITYDGYHSVKNNFDVLVIPENVPPPMEVMILDGRTATLNVFRQKGNQGGGGSVPRQITEGKGNANGALEPGEEATIWVHLHQGMDPFDKNNWYRAKVYSDSPWVTEVGNLEEQKQFEWTSGMERTSVIRLSPDTPHGTRIPLLLDNESWSYTWTPDVRYGVEKLYQAFQLHSHHLHRYEMAVP